MAIRYTLVGLAIEQFKAYAVLYTMPKLNDSLMDRMHNIARTIDSITSCFSNEEYKFYMEKTEEIWENA